MIIAVILQRIIPEVNLIKAIVLQALPPPLLQETSKKQNTNDLQSDARHSKSTEFTSICCPQIPGNCMVIPMILCRYEKFSADTSMTMETPNTWIKLHRYRTHQCFLIILNVKLNPVNFLGKACKPNRTRHRSIGLILFSCADAETRPWTQVLR